MKRKAIKLEHFLLLGIVTLMGFSACKKDPQIEPMYGVPSTSYHDIGQDASSETAEVAPLQEEYLSINED